MFLEQSAVLQTKIQLSNVHCFYFMLHLVFTCFFLCVLLRMHVKQIAAKCQLQSQIAFTATPEGLRSFARPCITNRRGPEKEKGRKNLM